MAATCNIATAGEITLVQRQIAAEISQLKRTTLIEDCDEILRKAFGDDEDIIANSLRGL